MSTTDYVLALSALISGLAIADVVVSLHRLIRARRVIRWDWLPLVSAAIALVWVTFSWFVTWRVSEMEGYNPAFWRFWILLAQLIFLYFMAAACLPDEAPATGLDLRAFYETDSA